MGDEHLYLLATQEVESDQQDEALWAKAIALSEGDKGKAKFKDISLRVNDLAKNDYSENKDRGNSIANGKEDIPRAKSSSEQSYDETAIPEERKDKFFAEGGHAAIEVNSDNVTSNNKSSVIVKLFAALIILIVGVGVSAIVKEKFGMGQFFTLAVFLLIILFAWRKS